MHFNDRRWQALAQDLSRLLHEHGCHPSQCVVLVPYAQLMVLARQAWVQHAGGASYLPRFETTQNWARSVWAERGGFDPAAEDLREDPALDLLNAEQWLVRGGLGAQREVLAPRLMEAAASLARLAAAVPPAGRSDWQARLLPQLTVGLDSEVLRLEASVIQLALAWAASSSYLTDILFEQQPALLVVLQGWQSDPLPQALLEARQPRALSLPLAGDAGPPGELHLQPATDAEEEAQRAAACVIERLRAGLQPVGLVAQDRALTRRIRALLAAQPVAVRDETGWTLSTTHAAAVVMGLLRAVAPRASTDEVLAWLKQVRSLDGQLVLEAEAQLRRGGVRRWSDIAGGQPQAYALAAQVAPWLDAMRKPRPLSLWLAGLRRALGDGGQWQVLQADTAGQAVIDALRLREDDQAELQAQRKSLTLSDFTYWVGLCLESGLFTPEHPPDAQVLVLPLGQLVGRTLAAVVMPGADELNWPASPTPPGPWTSRQRDLLGLPSRQDLMLSNRKAWLHALQHPQLDLLWRQSERGQAVMPSPLVQELMLGGVGAAAPDWRRSRQIETQSCEPAQAQGHRLPLAQLSASAYEDLRACPYRFFALRQLGLSADDELDVELDRRDIGNWLHASLRYFHEALAASPAPELVVRAALFDEAAERARAEAGLDAAEFLPHAAGLPALRDGYLQWLAEHEDQGHGFMQAEQWFERWIDNIKLVGKIDRIDRNAQDQLLLLDYKTEANEKTRARIKQAGEDTQLAFYAALVGEQAAGAAYLNLGERGQTRAHALPDMAALREQLLAGVHHDMARLAAAEPLRALGEGQSCSYCQARGLCRRDFLPAGQSS
ncbi:MAG: PD-(D/E)XK nuclease family protein [Betaproteobacteria bacterium]